MSSLIFYTDQDQILVVTDTLVVKPDGNPMMYCSKAIYLPHIRTIIAGTGVGMFSGDWSMQVNNRMVVAGIDNLDFHTPIALCKRWQQYKGEHALPADLTTTVYHFGLSEETGFVRSYAYRSTHSFASEQLGYGYGLKPECTPPQKENLIEEIPRMMVEQRKNQESKPFSDRVYIGGEAIAIYLNKSGCSIFSVFQFEDFQSQLRDIFRNYREDEC